MQQQRIAEVLTQPYAQALLRGSTPVRLAYTALDGTPRVVPLGFWLDDGRVTVATTPNAPKVPALHADPTVALTIDTSEFPPKVLLIRGTVQMEEVDGVPEGYLEGGRKFMTGEQYVDWEAGVRALYDRMVVITVTPTWAKLLDFETTIPQPVEELIQEKSAQQTPPSEG